jgi:hypothetical protein
MYAWIWNHLPGPTAVRVLIGAVLVLAVVASLFLWIFPWLEPRLPFTDVTVDSSATFSTELSTGGDKLQACSSVISA